MYVHLDMRRQLEKGGFIERASLLFHIMGGEQRVVMETNYTSSNDMPCVFFCARIGYILMLISRFGYTHRIHCKFQKSFWFWWEVLSLLPFYSLVLVLDLFAVLLVSFIPPSNPLKLLRARPEEMTLSGSFIGLCMPSLLSLRALVISCCIGFPFIMRSRYVFSFFVCLRIMSLAYLFLTLFSFLGGNKSWPFCFGQCSLKQKEPSSCMMPS